jgi:parvulin-like peptidyl-prolyl isomerase
LAKKKKKTTKPPREMTRRALSHHKRQVRRQRFIFFGGMGIIAAVVIIVLLGWYLGMYRPMHTTVITVGDEKYSTSYLVDYINIMGENQTEETIQQQFSNYASNVILAELIRLEAEKLDITVSDAEVHEVQEQSIFPRNDAAFDIIHGNLLRTKLNLEYFGPQVPDSQSQVHLKAMLVESEPVGLEVRDRLLQGEDFADLVAEFAADYTSRELNQGDYGWHPQSIMESSENVGSAVPVDYAFGAEAGAISPPLHDADVYKQRGYWLIKIEEKFTEDEFQVFALYLSSESEAEEIRQRLVNGEDLAALAAEYSQYAKSKENGGDMGLLVRPDEEGTVRVSDIFDAYVFDEAREVGVWSQPVREDTLWTQGGYWMVQVVDKDDDRELSSEDYNALMSEAYQEWANALFTEYADIIDQEGLTDDLKQMIISDVIKGR